MTEVNIDSKKKIEVLKVNVGDNAYSIPLGADIPYKDLRQLQTEKGIYEFLSKHFPEEVMDILTTRDVRRIFEAWTEATKKQTGITPGES